MTRFAVLLAYCVSHFGGVVQAQAVAGDDADLPVRLFHLRNTLRLMQQNAESPVNLPSGE